MILKQSKIECSAPTDPPGGDKLAESDSRIAAGYMAEHALPSRAQNSHPLGNITFCVSNNASFE